MYDVCRKGEGVLYDCTWKIMQAALKTFDKKKLQVTKIAWKCLQDVWIISACPHFQRGKSSNMRVDHTLEYILTDSAGTESEKQKIETCN